MARYLKFRANQVLKEYKNADGDHFKNGEKKEIVDTIPQGNKGGKYISTEKAMILLVDHANTFEEIHEMDADSATTQEKSGYSEKQHRPRGRRAKA